MEIASQILEAVQQLLDEPLHVDMEQPLMTAGVSSMLAVQLTSRLEAVFSMDLPGGQAFANHWYGAWNACSFQIFYHPASSARFPACCLQVPD